MSTFIDYLFIMDLLSTTLKLLHTKHSLPPNNLRDDFVKNSCFFYLTHCTHLLNSILLSNYYWWNWRNWRHQFASESKTFSPKCHTVFLGFIYTLLILLAHEIKKVLRKKDPRRYVTWYSFDCIKFHYAVNRFLIQKYIQNIFSLILNSWL